MNKNKYRLALFFRLVVFSLILSIGFFNSIVGNTEEVESESTLYKKQSQSVNEQIELIDKELQKIAKNLEEKPESSTLILEISQKEQDIRKIDQLILDTRLVVGQLDRQILENQEEIEALNSEIRDLLLDLQARQVNSPIKMLFSSQNLGKALGQIYNTSSLTQKIDQKKLSIEEKNKEIEKVKLQNQEIQLNLEKTRDLLRSQQSSLEYLLEETQGQELNFQRLVGAINTQKKQLEGQLDTLKGEYIAETSHSKTYSSEFAAGDCPFEEKSDLDIPSGYFVPPARGFLTQDYHCGHDGIDIANGLGSAIFSIASGEVVRVGPRSDGCVGLGCNGGFGNFIVVKHVLPSNQRVYSLYAHLQTVPNKTVGEPVQKGEIIGKMGCTGYTIPYPCGVHLHFMLLSDSLEKNGIGCRYGSSKCYNPRRFIKL